MIGSVEDSLKWLDDREPSWKLDKPVDRDKFVKELLASEERINLAALRAKAVLSAQRE